MADYAADISSTDYIYIREISITETGGEDRVDFPIKLTFDSSNFTFEFARSDGKDIRVGERSNGTQTLNMWIATWDTTNRIGVIWLKIPLLPANRTKTLYVYCGNSTDTGISDVNSVGFIFSDGFDGTSIDTTKWGYSDIQDVADSKIRIKTNGYITSSGIPLSGIINWVVEDGIYLNDALTATDKAYYRYRFYGTENNFGFNYYGQGIYCRRSTLVNGSTWVTYSGTERGLEGQSYSENFIAYNEPNDKVYQSMARRDSYSDYIDSWERQVSGDTRITYFRIYGRNNDTAPWVYIDWVIVREYFETDPYSFDTSNLRPPWELVAHQTIDWIDYDSDVTGVDYYHFTSSGGDPYGLSDNEIGSTTNCWYSDEGAASGSLELVIDFARGPNNLVSDNYLHYDSGHNDWLNASKLSNDNDDIWGNNHFHGATASGYVCIDFGDDNVAVGCLSVKGYTTSSGMAKNFIFRGSYVDPRLSTNDEWDTLYTGIFKNITDWQTIYFVNGKPYRYYKLDVSDTYNDGEITIQEWGMYEYNPACRKMIISHIRLLPVVVDSSEAYFPKQIKLMGSNGLDVWETLISTSNTYTPFFDYIWGRWQRYSFTNTKGYYTYKLTCTGNWNDNVGKVAIAEWEMCERSSESYTYRILAGSSNNFNSIWADNDITFDSGFFYVVNDGLNIIYDNGLAEYTTISGSVLDINVI